MAQTVNHLLAMWETQVQSLCQEDPLEKEMATHSNTVAWKTPWMEEPGGYSPWVTKSRTGLRDFTFTFTASGASHYVPPTRLVKIGHQPFDTIFGTFDLSLWSNVSSHVISLGNNGSKCILLIMTFISPRMVVKHAGSQVISRQADL